MRKVSPKVSVAAELEISVPRGEALAGLSCVYQFRDSVLYTQVCLYVCLELTFFYAYMYVGAYIYVYRDGHVTDMSIAVLDRLRFS